MLQLDHTKQCFSYSRQPEQEIIAVGQHMLFLQENSGESQPHLPSLPISILSLKYFFQLKLDDATKIKRCSYASILQAVDMTIKKIWNLIPAITFWCIWTEMFWWFLNSHFHFHSCTWSQVPSQPFAGQCSPCI